MPQQAVLSTMQNFSYTYSEMERVFSNVGAHPRSVLVIWGKDDDTVRGRARDRGRERAREREREREGGRQGMRETENEREEQR